MKKQSFQTKQKVLIEIESHLIDELTSERLYFEGLNKKFTNEEKGKKMKKKLDEKNMREVAFKSSSINNNFNLVK